MKWLMVTMAMLALAACATNPEVKIDPDYQHARHCNESSNPKLPLEYGGCSLLAYGPKPVCVAIVPRGATTATIREAMNKCDELARYGPMIPLGPFVSE